MKVIAERAILFGARSGREPGFLTVERDERVRVLDRGAIGKKGGWQVHRFPGPFRRTSSYAPAPHRPVSSRDERAGKVNAPAPPVKLARPLCGRAPPV
jgi:hypothetical protein